MYYPVIPTDMKLTVTAAYITGKGIPVVITNMTTLPLRLIVKPCAPIKEADYKVTVSTNKPAVSLLDLFPGRLFLSLQLLNLKKNKKILQYFSLFFSFLSLQNLFWIALCQMLQASNTLEVPMSLCYRPKHRKGTVFQRTVLEVAPYV